MSTLSPIYNPNIESITLTAWTSRRMRSSPIWGQWTLGKKKKKQAFLFIHFCPDSHLKIQPIVF